MGIGRRSLDQAGWGRYSDLNSTFGLVGETVHNRKEASFRLRFCIHGKRSWSFNYQRETKEGLGLQRD